MCFGVVCVHVPHQRVSLTQTKLDHLASSAGGALVVCVVILLCFLCVCMLLCLHDDDGYHDCCSFCVGRVLSCVKTQGDAGQCFACNSSSTLLSGVCWLAACDHATVVPQQPAYHLRGSSMAPAGAESLTAARSHCVLRTSKRLTCLWTE